MEEAFLEAAWRQPSILLMDDLDHIVGVPSTPEHENSPETVQSNRLAYGMFCLCLGRNIMQLRISYHLSCTVLPEQFCLYHYCLWTTWNSGRDSQIMVCRHLLIPSWIQIMHSGSWSSPCQCASTTAAGNASCQCLRLLCSFFITYAAIYIAIEYKLQMDL